jgi:mono/diheme cytochrome c family protein
MRAMALLLGFLLASHATAPGQERAPQSNVPSDSLIHRGRRVFEGAAGCHGCHGKDGRGTSAGPDLTDREWLHGSGSLAEIHDRIEGGVSRKESKTGLAMPMGGWEALSPDDVTAVAAYVRWLGRAARRPREGTGGSAP